MPLHGVAPVIYSCHGTIGKSKEIQHVVGSWPLETSSGVCIPVYKCLILEGNKMFTRSHQSNPSESQVAEKSPWQPTREVLQSICPFEHHLSAMEIEVWFVVHEMRRKKLTERNKVLPSTYGDVSLIRPSSSAASKSPPSSCRQWQPCVEESHYSV